MLQCVFITHTNTAHVAPMSSMQVSSRDHLIVLDTQPVLSTERLLSLLKAGRPHIAIGPAAAHIAGRAAPRQPAHITAGPQHMLSRSSMLGVSTPVEEVAMIMDLQMITFLFSVCHVVSLTRIAYVMFRTQKSNMIDNRCGVSIWHL